jgi:hypothetical protein
MIFLLVVGMLLNPVQPIYFFQPNGTTTPLKELERSHKVRRGLVCFGPDEVKCIDEVCGEPPFSYWRVKVNDNSYSFNANSPVSPADRIEWEFVSSKEK